METLDIDGKSVKLHVGDITGDETQLAIRLGNVGWDIETSGLNWREETIGTCQLNIGDVETVIVRVTDQQPRYLCDLLCEKRVRKIFHHAMFDLRFMSHRWSVVADNVACTKIASKLLDADNKRDHSLKSLLQAYLGVNIDKSERLSNWNSSELTEGQILYAAKDVMYLPSLLDRLEDDLEKAGLLELSRLCFAHIPTRVQLDILGYQDLYEY